MILKAQGQIFSSKTHLHWYMSTPKHRNNFRQGLGLQVNYKLPNNFEHPVSDCFYSTNRNNLLSFTLKPSDSFKQKKVDIFYQKLSPTKPH